MINVLLVLNIIVVMLLIGIILLQKSEGGVLGMGGGSKNALFTTHSAGNLVTRITYILAATLFVICMLLALLVSRRNGETKSFVEIMSERGGTESARPIETPQVNKIPEDKVKEEMSRDEAQTEAGAGAGTGAKKPLAPRD
jgi:preprotein translocase subunit SecG